MAICKQKFFGFPTSKSRKILVDFNGGDVSSDAGVLLVRQADRKLRLTEELHALLKDPRRQASCDHTQMEMLQQRIYGLALGYEDLNDHETLRQDVALQTAVQADQELASSATLCRWENRADRETAGLISEWMVEQFIRSFEQAPEELILDFDATDDKVHGKQEGRFFHGYYDHYCFLPLYVFCGDQLLVSYLRPSNIDSARHAWAILALLVRRLRKVWPKVKIIFRGDSGFCRWRMLRWCESHDVRYIVGIAKNSRLDEMAEPLLDRACRQYEKTGQKQRLFRFLRYAALSWDHERQIIVKAEHTEQGRNPRYVVTNLTGDPQELYDQIYCGRGDMENRIKEQQLDLFADRTSCTKWWANQFRLLLSSLAYLLLEAIRRLGLKGTELARAQCGSIRLKLLKIGAVVRRNTRRVYFHLSSACPYQKMFLLVAQRLSTA
jgi:hypothetical protein